MKDWSLLDRALTGSVRSDRALCLPRYVTLVTRGPLIYQVIPDPSKLNMSLKVNGEQRQETPVSDLLFDVRTAPRIKG